MEMQRCIMSDEDLAVRMAKESSPAHLNRQRVRISSTGISCESCVKKYRSWLSDSDCQSVGRDKLKNASILRKYGSICMGEKTISFLKIYPWLFLLIIKHYHNILIYNCQCIQY